MRINFLSTSLFLLALMTSCSVSVAPVYNKSTPTSSGKNKAQINEITDRDDLKSKAAEQVARFHQLIENGSFDDAYQMIDDSSPMKSPKASALANMQEVIHKLGRLEKIDLNRDKVVQDQSLNDGQLQVRQEFVVRFEKDTASPKRYELFNWNVYGDGTLKLWTYTNAKGDD